MCFAGMRHCWESRATAWIARSNNQSHVHNGWMDGMGSESSSRRVVEDGEDAE